MVRLKVSNLSRKKSISASVEIADNEVSRMRGLMFREKIVPILFIFDSEGIFPIHSYFVKGEFDAIYLSSNRTITEIFAKIPPNTPLVTPKKKARYLIELPPSASKKLRIAVGDKMDWGD